MSYQLDWEPLAEEELAGVWQAANDRPGVRWAVDRIEARLRRDPLEFGESRSSSVDRVAFIEPVGVYFEVIEDDKRVRVLACWATR